MLTIARRELEAYFATPFAYVLLITFAAAATGLPIFVDDFFGREQADLQSFFRFHPWIYLFLMPAIAMRLWSEEKRDGTFELLMTLPISTSGAVLGKFFAAWLFAGIALALTAPMWITVNYLGEPDNLVIAIGYCASWLMAGCYLGIGACSSALAANQVVAFIFAVLVGFAFLAVGLPPVQTSLILADLSLLANILDAFSVEGHFSELVSGIVGIPAVFFFISLFLSSLVLNVFFIDIKRVG